MIIQLDEIIIRQRTIELNNRLDRLYVPGYLSKTTRSVWSVLAILFDWIRHAGSVQVKHGQSPAPDAAVN